MARWEEPSKTEGPTSRQKEANQAVWKPEGERRVARSRARRRERMVKGRCFREVAMKSQGPRKPQKRSVRETIFVVAEEGFPSSAVSFNGSWGGLDGTNSFPL